jgi:hypothetical protein
VRRGSVIPSLYILVSVEFLLSDAKRKNLSLCTMHDDVGLGSANESVQFLYRGKLVLYSSKKSICKE